MEVLKRNSTPIEGLKENYVSKNVKVQETEKEQEEKNENCSPNKNSFDANDIKYKCSTPKQTKKMDKEVENKEEMQKCDKCKYTCQKETSLKKHILTKHKEYQCKEYQMK